jgi:Aspartyl protease
VEIQTPRGKRTLRALLDSGAQGNFIFQAVILEKGISCEKTATRVNGVGGHTVAVHGRGRIVTHTTDMRGISRWGQHSYYTASLEGFKLILGMPWLKSVNLDVN